MTQYHFKKNQEIEMKNLDNFLREVARKKNPLTSLPLCKMEKEWLDFVNNDNRSELPHPGGQRLPRGNPPSKPGIYAIFARKSKSERPLCFHVGISSNDIRGRIRTRLYKDVTKDYRNIFGRLRDYADIYVCSVTIPALNNSGKAKIKLKAKLELLEMYMTVVLGSKSLFIATGIP
jgi:hypothetical protein